MTHNPKPPPNVLVDYEEVTRINAEIDARRKAEANGGAWHPEVSNATPAPATKKAPAKEKKTAGEKKKSQAEELIEIATRPDVDLSHTADGVAFADITVDGHRETWSLNSRGFRRWLKREFYNLRKSAPNSDAMSQAMGVIDAMAHFDGEEREVYLRVANVDDKIYLDLCNDAWEAIEITDEGWDIVANPPVRFRRKRGMQEIPRPIKGANIETVGGLKDRCRRRSVLGSGQRIVDPDTAVELCAEVQSDIRRISRYEFGWNGKISAGGVGICIGQIRPGIISIIQ